MRNFIFFICRPFPICFVYESDFFHAEPVWTFLCIARLKNELTIYHWHHQICRTPCTSWTVDKRSRYSSKHLLYIACTIVQGSFTERSSQSESWHSTCNRTTIKKNNLSFLINDQSEAPVNELLASLENESCTKTKELSILTRWLFWENVEMCSFCRVSQTFHPVGQMINFPVYCQSPRIRPAYDICVKCFVYYVYLTDGYQNFTLVLSYVVLQT